MDNSEITQRIAHALLRQHQRRDQSRPLTGDLAPADLAEAYAAQMAFQELIVSETAKGPIAGYKIALTSVAMQKMIGIDRPCAGAIFENTISQGPVEIKQSNFMHLGIEFELAVRLGQDLPPSNTPYRGEAMAEYVDACYPAFELIEDRKADYRRLDALTLVADNAWNGGIVLGSVTGNWRELDLASALVSLHWNDEEPQKAMTGAAMDHPFNALAWVANHLSALDITLEAGMVVMTGSTLVTRFPEVGDKIRYEIAGLGAVSVEIV